MSQLNLYKGFEVELFTGSFNSHIGVSADVEKNFSNFVKEPDNRNVEYITTPEKDYMLLHRQLISPRKNLRQWLNKKGLTITLRCSVLLCSAHMINIKRSLLRTRPVRIRAVTVSFANVLSNNKEYTPWSLNSQLYHMGKNTT